MTRSRRVKWAENISSMEEKRNAYVRVETCVEKPEREIQFGRCGCRWA
jgi:hypothetical protein